MKVEWVALGEVLVRAGNVAAVDPTADYPMLGVKSHARGAFDSGVLHGSRTAYATLTQVREGWVVYPKLMALEGALARVPAELDGHWVTPEFVTYEIGSKELSGDYLGNLMAWSGFVEWVRAGSTGTNVRRRRLQPDNFEAIRIPLPDRDVQDRIARYLHRMSPRQAQRSELEAVLDRFVTRRTIDTPQARLGSLLALQRRAISVEPEAVYQEIGVRSFGRGLFTKEPLTGAELGGKRVFRVAEGDFIVSSVFAWEGAIGVADPAHNGLIGSHRFMTWTPNDDLNVQYLRAYFRSQVGVARLAAASPGSAGRNRTLSVRNFEAIEVPLPDRAEQDQIAAAMAAIDNVSRVAARADRLSEALLPAARNEIFNSMR